MNPSNGGLSTISTLQPSEGKGINYKRYLTSQRLQGSHRFSLTRPSKIPESGREYAPGDPINLIDWKAFARTDHLMIRQMRDEAAAKIRIYVDLTATMQWPRGHTNQNLIKVTKAEIAIRCALNLAFLHHRSGDIVELWPIFKDQDPCDKVLRIRRSSDLISCFESCFRSDFASETVSQFCVFEKESNTKLSDIVYYFSDALATSFDYLSHLKRGKISAFFHVFSSLEENLNWVQDPISYFDDARMKKEYLGRILRSNDQYIREIERWREKMSSDLQKIQSFYRHINDKTPIAEWHSMLDQIAKSTTFAASI